MAARPCFSAAPWPGALTVLGGRVWLTRRGDIDDHILDAEQRLHLAGGDGAVIEAWQPAAGATLRWTPDPQPRPRVSFLTTAAAGSLALLAGLSARAARGLAGAALGFGALARRAASSARRAQGCIPIGDSMACGGTVQ